MIYKDFFKSWMINDGCWILLKNSENQDRKFNHAESQNIVKFIRYFKNISIKYNIDKRRHIYIKYFYDWKIILICFSNKPNMTPLNFFDVNIFHVTFSSADIDSETCHRILKCEHHRISDFITGWTDLSFIWGFI